MSISSLSSSIPFRSRQSSTGDIKPDAHPPSPLFSPKPATAYHGEIIFPKLYEDAWGSASDSYHTVIERSRIFLVRMAMMNPDRTIAGLLRHIITGQRTKSVAALACDIQHMIFQNRHVTFATDSLKQAVRFMLIKCKIPEGVLSDRAQEVVDFFFDPTIEINLRPKPPGEVTIYPCPQGRLKVAIIGGGPTALASAISLAEKGEGKVIVHLWERRWVENRSPGGGIVIGYPSTARRRDQVVTLQDSVTRLLSKPSFDALFAGRPERVWPGSANIQIRKVEDRFLKRVQEPEFAGLIHLHAEGVTKVELEKVGDFHILLGADGAASWVRGQFFEGYENERGRSWALGIAFDRPAGLPWSQPLNIFLTLGQTRYLLNASDHDGRGYLNMQLTDDEWDKMLSVDGQPIHFGRPGCLRRPDGSIPTGFEPGQVFAPSEDRTSPLWISIEDGLKLFGFKESDVINVVRIPIVVQAVREGVRILPGHLSRSLKRPHALVAVAGDAAMTVHFWPGRGLNSGIKSGLALGDELVHALSTGKFIGAPLSAMKEYNSFIMALQTREHDKRSIPILNQSGSPETLGWLLSKASTVPDHVATEWLVGAMTQISDRLQTRSDWNYPLVPNVEPQLRICLRQMNSITLQEMAVSFPWPTREMAGAEVLPVRSMKPAEKQRWIMSLWTRMQEERKTATASSRGKSDDEPVRAVRFEAPRQGVRKSPSPSPNRQARRENLDTPTANTTTGSSGGALSRSNASIRHRAGSDARTYSHSHSRSTSLAIPQVNGGTVVLHEGGHDRSRSVSPSPSSDGREAGGNVDWVNDSNAEVSLGRMMTVSKRPPAAMLGEALSLALFRMREAE